MYKILGFKWLCEVFCPASAFATADSDASRNPQRILRIKQVFDSIFMLRICINQHKGFADSQLQKPDIPICS